MLTLNVIDEGNSRLYGELVSFGTLEDFFRFLSTETKVVMLSILTFAFSKQTHI